MSIFFVALLGINHNEYINTFKDLIAVKSLGCLSINLQKRDIDKVITKEFSNFSKKNILGKTNSDQKEGLKFNFE